MCLLFSLQFTAIARKKKQVVALFMNLLFPFSIISSPLFPSPQNTEHSYKEMIVIQGHRSKELDPHEQIQNSVGNRIATPKWKHVCQVYTFKDHEHQTGFPGSRGFQCCGVGEEGGQTVALGAGGRWMLTSGHGILFVYSCKIQSL